MPQLEFTLGDYIQREGEYRTITASIDFKSTGSQIIYVENQPHDLIWAFSIAVMRYNPITEVARVLDIYEHAIKIEKNPNESWEELYKRRNWEIRCAAENLLATDSNGSQKNLERFYQRQKNAKLSNIKELGVCFNQALTDIENKAAGVNGALDEQGSPRDLQFTWCTMDFDTICACIVLGVNGFPTMARWRNGVYNGGGHFFHSYISGILKRSINDATWEKTEKEFKIVSNTAWQTVSLGFELCKNAIYCCMRFFIAGSKID